MTTGFEPVVNLWIGGLISADANTTNEERKENIEELEKLLSEYGETLLDYQIDCAKKGIEMLKKEIEENKDDDTDTMTYYQIQPSTDEEVEENDEA